MKLIINHSSMQPIYEQIVEQIKSRVMHGELKEDTALPSVRTLAKELKVSALTVKKAYDVLEEEGFVNTVHGKGSFVAFASQGLMLEEKKKRAEFLGSALTISITGSQISLTTSEISLVFSVPLSSGLRPTQK